MAWGNDFHANNLSFDTNACLLMLEKIYDLFLDDLSHALVAIVQREIFLNGNGSTLMRMSAAAEVVETKREITRDEIRLEAGIDSATLKSQENVYVRVMVVLHGNQGSGPLMTKPGQLTWNKHVLVKRMSTARSAYPMPNEFNKTDKETDIVAEIESNISKQANTLLNAFVHNVQSTIDMLDWSAWINVR